MFRKTFTSSSHEINLSVSILLSQISFEILKISIIPKHFEKATNIAVLYVLSKVYFSIYH